MPDKSVASPEQFLREFATEIMSQAWKYGSEAKLEATIKGWAKLLKLREEAAVREALEEVTTRDLAHCYHRPPTVIQQELLDYIKSGQFTTYAAYARLKGVSTQAICDRARKLIEKGWLEINDQNKLALTTPNNTSNTLEEG